MLGFLRASESLGSQLVCPSYRRHRLTDLHSCSPLLIVRDPTRRLRSFATTKVYNRAWNNNGNGDRDWPAGGQMIPQGLRPPSILEAGHVGSGGYEPSRTDSPVESSHSLEAEFNAILGDGQPDQVMDALINPRFESLVWSMPQSTFVEAFHLLSPAYFIDPYREIHRPLHPSAVDLKQYRSLDSIFDEFTNNLAAILHKRRSAGQPVGLAEYTHLLDCARSMGDAMMADYIWHAIREEELVPDAQCYSLYMEAKVWDKAYTGLEKYRTRLTPYLYRKRRFFTPNTGWQGYGTAGRSVRKEVLQIFNEMTLEGTPGSTTAFVNVILASSRVGHLQGIKNVLHTVWNIDVDALLEQVDESILPEVVPYDRSSPLYPTNHLLFAIAHAFGTNNDIPAALRTIDFISNKYDIPVPENVWLELFERSFVLSRPRFGPDAERNAKGKVSYDFLNTMFETMTAEPFNVRPTIEVHHILAKTAWDRARLSEFQRHMRAAYEILKETRRKRRTARSIIEAYLGHSKAHRVGVHPTLLRSRAFADAVHAYDILRLRTFQQTTIMERLARLLLIHHRWVGRDNPAWERSILPRALEEWRDFLPESLSYAMRGGLVQFHGATFWGQRNIRRHRNVPVRRPALDTDVELEDEANELDDDSFWEDYRQSAPHLDLTSPPLKRLFGAMQESDEASGYMADEQDEFLADELGYEAEAPGAREVVRMPKRKRATTRKRQTNEVDDAFDTTPGYLSWT
ncbi:uncharacterized protein BO80DRAFT_426458 [Aspergillus ibericus CBS 121593]|uniref:Mitochondrial ATPase expression-domain-containing protein n=1 Tax=Aspergillus ibericus CBS 121593 TaxID=1448316 RepID=A0A395GWR5_9EURO|nr:hypothetical protein BO80DRAFT_426458 [Aspergillus ibericus CBS 121593]RAK99468.1 hypothetical protein BO80DRAFT_426458 [Aspergillus ibericus CBS 121593]